MAKRSKKKGQKKSRKKGWAGKVFLIVALGSVAFVLIYLFRQEISNVLRPVLEKKGAMKEKREALKEKKERVREKKVVTLYFSDEGEEYLIGEKREIAKQDEVREEAEETIHELIKGPKGKLLRTLPPRTKILALQVDANGVARVNFNQALHRDHPGGSSAEMMTLYSVVNSLAFNFPEIKKVQILIEGEKSQTIAGHLSLEQPLSSKPDLIKKQ
jgi:spore germination protein GerM